MRMRRGANHVCGKRRPSRMLGWARRCAVIVASLPERLIAPVEKPEVYFLGGLLGARLRPPELRNDL